MTADAVSSSKTGGKGEDWIPVSTGMTEKGKPEIAARSVY